MMPLTIDFMVSPGIAGTAYDRGAAHPSRPRKHWPGYWPARVRTPGPRMATTWHCAHRVVSRNCDPSPRSLRRGTAAPGNRGSWQAVIPEPNGKQVITRHTLDQLLDKLDELTREREP